jgi:hypothetical protein
MSFQQALADGIRSVYCQSADIADQFWSRVGIPGTPIRAPFQPRASLGYRLLCNREPPPVPGSPVTGGQCDTLYNVTVSYSYQTPQGGSCPTFNESQTFNGRLGPIRGTRLFREGSDVGYYLLHAPQSGFPTGETRSVIVVDGGGGVCNAQMFSATVTSIVRVDGLPDDCGDAPPVVPNPPSPNPTFSFPIVYVDASGNTIELNGTAIFAAGFAYINGQLNIPFRVTINPDITIPIDGTINLETGDINFNFGGGNGGGGCEPKPPSGYEPTNPPPPNPEPGNPPAPPIEDNPTDTRLKDIIRGVIATVSDDDGKVTVIDQSSNPDLYIPRVGNVQFAIQIGNSISWTERVNVTSLRQFIPCPWEGGAVDVRGTSEPGFIMTLTPVVGKIPDDVSYET